MPPLPELAVRPAHPEDAAAASDVICASIRFLCSADHHDERDAIANWLANKSPDSIAAMIADPLATVWVAEREGSIVAVGQTTRPGHAEGAGKITLNYVVPAARRTGASSVLLSVMETSLAAEGITRAHLTSTETALKFYLAHGWQPSAPPRKGRWIVGHPLEKEISSPVDNKAGGAAP
jgi:N-acetylglutamate synthase-like GNAT family acetyltransferase